MSLFHLATSSLGLPHLGTLAWRPFLDPIMLGVHTWLLLLIPLALAIALVYKTIKLDDLAKLPWQVAVLTGQIIFYMALAGVLLWVLVVLV